MTPNEHPCATPDCTTPATLSPLCHLCESKWLNDREAVIREAEHRTDVHARFLAWCRERGLDDRE